MFRFGLNAEDKRAGASFFFPVADSLFFSFTGSSPLKRHFGKHEVPMSVDGVLGYLKSMQSERKLRERDVIHDEVELGLKLHGREAAEDAMISVFRQRQESLSKQPQPQDRIRYPMVVCSGMKGLGKTRMLEEWPRLFELAEIPKPWLGVFMNYGNGHAPEDFEKTMPIQAAFGWRMLHHLFVEGNCEDREVASWSRRAFLPSNADELSLARAFDVIVAAAKEFGLVDADSTLSLFLGIDEYQKIPCGPDYNPKAENQKKERAKTFLWKLIAALDTCRSVRGLHLYVGFAGTRWGPMSIGGSSVPGTQRAPLHLLSPAMMEDVVRSNEQLRKQLADPEFRRNLFFLGGVPRPSVLYALGRETFNNAWLEYVREKWFNQETGLTSKELLHLIAHAVSGGKIEPSDPSGIKELKWGRLFDEGLCMLLPTGQLGIPYCVFRLAAGMDASPSWAPALKCLLQNLKYLKANVDDVLFDNEPWYSWEKFGACFFAMRVNSLLVLGYNTVPFSRLLRGSVVHGCSAEVQLVPMEVHAIEEELTSDVGMTVTERKHRRSLNWVTGDAGIWYCLLNCAGGKGLDFFSALPLADGTGGLVLYNDQRKVVAASLGDRTAKALLTKASIVPQCLPGGSRCVRGLFSILASFNGSLDDIPEDCCVLSYRQHAALHGTLALHPACKTYVDVNYDNLSTLRMLKSVEAIASNIIQHRLGEKFVDVEAFVAFCKQQGKVLSDEDRFRIVA